MSARKSVVYIRTTAGRRRLGYFATEPAAARAHHRAAAAVLKPPLFPLRHHARQTSS